MLGARSSCSTGAARSSASGRSGPLERLEQQLELAVALEDYEEAARIRDQIRRLRAADPREHRPTGLGLDRCRIASIAGRGISRRRFGCSLDPRGLARLQ